MANLSNASMLVGIDYGSKLAGTTVMAYTIDDEVHLIESKKKEDADQLILEFLKAREVELIGIDAPLSLPNALTSGNGADFFYRQSDKELKAMSPMFLGGLTARAIKLNFSLSGVMKEVYPGALARRLELKRFGYKTNSAEFRQMLDLLDWPFSINIKLKNGHQLDAILALYIIWKLKNDRAFVAGNSEEGCIYY